MNNIFNHLSQLILTYLLKKEYFDATPWSVENVAVFLKYCCPECDYNDGDLKIFSNHALENHERYGNISYGKLK